MTRPLGPTGTRHVVCSWRRVLALLALLLGVARAHNPSDAYLSLTVRGAAVTGHWDVSRRDLAWALHLTPPDGGPARPAFEPAAVLARLGAALRLDADGRACVIHWAPRFSDAEHLGVGYVRVSLRATCPGAVRRLGVTYRLIPRRGVDHRGLVEVHFIRAGHPERRDAALGRYLPSWEVDLTAPGPWASVRSLFGAGVLHIWTGIDHILFLLSLLFPAVLRRVPGAWVPERSFRLVALRVFEVVSAFTAAHSITLALAALRLVVLPPRLVESVIAASVLLAALNNLVPVVPGARRWALAFAFGLLHGFGFASALRELAAGGGLLLPALLGFNLGVEAGQLAVVAAFLPLAFLARRTRAYALGVVGVGSGAVAAVALVWLVQRAFGLPILRFLAV